MARERAERLALTEAAISIANERMSEWPERRSPHNDEAASYFCECALEGCREAVSLSATQYEQVREHTRHFFVLRDHILPDLETEVERHEGYSVIEKPTRTSMP